MKLTLKIFPLFFLISCILPKTYKLPENVTRVASIKKTVIKEKGFLKKGISVIPFTVDDAFVNQRYDLQIEANKNHNIKLHYNEGDVVAEASFSLNLNPGQVAVAKAEVVKKRKPLLAFSEETELVAIWLEDEQTSVSLTNKVTSKVFLPQRIKGYNPLTDKIDVDKYKLKTPLNTIPKGLKYPF